MEADFSGWATKANIKCSDGRTIMPNAFLHQDTQQVPLVWQHGHTDPENVLGHAILEHRDEGVYCYGFFNKTKKAQHIKDALEHKDFNAMSIWANGLMETAKRVTHGMIKEVSLVLAGANPGALIENINIRHADGDEELLDDEAIIYMNIPIKHAGFDPDAQIVIEDKPDPETLKHVDDDEDKEKKGKTVPEIIDGMTEEQQAAVATVVGAAIEETTAALTESAEAEHSDTNNTNDDDTNADNGKKGDTEMANELQHNVFDQTKGKGEKETVLSHDELNGIVEKAKRTGTLKTHLEDYVLAHGLENIGDLFPDAHLVTSTPEFRKRRTEWVDKVLTAVTKSPFGRIKTLSADLTFEAARAKGYVKGSLKKEEFFPIANRVTTPTTIYKKQKLDRDDMIDITDFDVVIWLKGEMRVMLDEEIARALLVSDGRDVSHEDKINEQNIRPIAKDNDLFATEVPVNISDANSSAQEIIDAIVQNRRHFRGSGSPTFYTTETVISMFMMLKDTTGRRIYRSLDEVAQEIRVSEIVAVEVMEEYTDLIGVIVNLTDYTIGADKGGEVSMFDDFDIDYNQYKYLIETRISGALTKLKSALIIKSTAAGVTIITPQAPTFNSNTGVITIPTQTGVVYKNAAGTTLTAGAQTALDPGEDMDVFAWPSSGSYAFANNEDDNWNFQRESV